MIIKLFYLYLKFFCGPPVLGKLIHEKSNKYSDPNGTRFFFGKGELNPWLGLRLFDNNQIDPVLFFFFSLQRISRICWCIFIFSSFDVYLSFLSFCSSVLLYLLLGL